MLMKDPMGWLAGLPVVDLVIVLVVITAGWLAGRWLGDWTAARFAKTEWVPPGFSGRTAKTVQAAVLCLALVVLLSAPGFSTEPRLLAGIVLGFALTGLVRNMLRGLGLLEPAAPGLGILAGVLAVVAALGGLRPLMMALDNAALTIGKRQISLLDVLVTAFAGMVLFALAWLLNRALGHWVGQLRGLDGSQRLLGQKLVGLGIAAIAFLIGIDLIGLDLTSLAVFSGALGLAVGFGLQKTLGNMIAGLLLLMDRSVKPGDVIVVGDQFGQVNRIGVRAVSVLTRDGKEHLIPNELLMTQAVENWSHSDRKVRVHIPVGVSYACDLAKAQALMLDAARAIPRVLADPAPGIWLRGFGDSSVDHDIMVWINDPEEGVGNIRSAILNRVWVLFKENGIEIPFPQRDVWIKNADQAGKSTPPSA
jgi:small-conductance mechanosensitive channel